MGTLDPDPTIRRNRLWLMVLNTRSDPGLRALATLTVDLGTSPAATFTWWTTLSSIEIVWVASLGARLREGARARARARAWSGAGQLHDTPA